MNPIQCSFSVGHLSEGDPDGGLQEVVRRQRVRRGLGPHSVSVQRTGYQFVIMRCFAISRGLERLGRHATSRAD
jgi:hypothetical protein